MSKRRFNALPDFDKLLEIAANGPEALEELRSDLVDQLIESAPQSQRARLRGLQFQVDMVRRKSKSPTESCLRISEMMHESLWKMYDLITDSIPVHKGPTARILAFKDPVD